MTIYWIPVYGFIVAGMEYHKAYTAHSACIGHGRECWTEYEATWLAFDHVTAAFVATMLFCVASIVFCQIMKLRAQNQLRKLRRERAA